jgi:hypothetical protein
MSWRALAPWGRSTAEVRRRRLLCRNRQTIRVERELRCFRQIEVDRTIIALCKPVAGEPTLRDQNRKEIPLRTSYALTSVEEPP